MVLNLNLKLNQNQPCERFRNCTVPKIVPGEVYIYVMCDAAILIALCGGPVESRLCDRDGSVGWSDTRYNIHCVN